MALKVGKERGPVRAEVGRQSVHALAQVPRHDLDMPPSCAEDASACHANSCLLKCAEKGRNSRRIASVTKDTL